MPAEVEAEVDLDHLHDCEDEAGVHEGVSEAGNGIYYLC